ncbi:MAG: 3-methyladenine DNA glycosylase [Propionibacteriales bacterium]|nr:3-methyladenine DNA glycosylase [Propionibacteriales bacterium]
MDADSWHAKKARHEARVDAWITPHLERRSRGLSHPVEDFLFTYYSYRPAALRRWHPGFGVTLTGAGIETFKGVKGYDVSGGRARVDPRRVAERRAELTAIRNLLLATESRPPALRCFGLHEWAMVYQQSPAELRHGAYPLRLGVEGTAEVIRSHRISCTHYDAFRFFTPAARPLNAVQPGRETRERHEQPGCLHATMDCYKWAYQLAPFTSAELVADCFELAREVRGIDMRAAPYDLTGLGVEPLPIETAAGKAEYVARQREFAGRASVLRARLVNTCEETLRSSADART